VRVLYVSRSRGVHDGRFTDAWAAAGAEVSALAVDDIEPGPPGAAFEAALDEALERWHPDLVHVGPLTWPGAVVAERWTGPLIATSWGFDLMHDIDVDPRALAQATAVVTRADRLFVDNDGPARRARELGAEDSAVISFPWGIDGTVFSWGDAGARDPYLVVSVRRHEPTYRVADVLEAFVAASAREPRLRLALAGSGSLTPDLRARAEQAGVADLVTWPGDLDAAGLAALLRSGGLYVSSSPVDGSSVSLLEAMASGIPVVVADIEGNRQWVSHSTGWRFAPGDTAALAELLARLPGDPELSARARAAADLVASRADWAATAARFLQFGAEAIAAASERASG